MAHANTVQSLATVLKLDPDALALQFGDDGFTYGQLAAAVAAVRSALRDVGVKAGSPVATVLPNTPAGLVSLLAVLGERACIVTISPRRVDLDLAKAPVTLATLGPPAALPEGVPVSCGVDLAIARGSTRAAPQPGIALLMATSGTTGEPKRIPITYATIDGVVGGVRALAGGTKTELQLRDDTTLICFPYTNLSGVLPQLIALVSGRRTALLERFDPERVAQLVHRHQMTSLALNPTAMQMLMDADIEPSLLDSVRYVRSGSAPLRPALAAAFEERFGAGVLQSYGQTEVGGEVVGWSSADHRAFGTAKRGSVGRPHPGVELQIVPPGQEPGQPMGDGEIGELWLRGARNVEGWHRTGDLARIDPDGFVWIEGRADGVIICGGFNIVPAALERILDSHESVKESAVVARPDKRLGEIPIALVVRKPFADVDADELLELCGSNAEPYQIPRAIRFVDELPRTEIGKLHLPSLRDLAAADPSVA